MIPEEIENGMKLLDEKANELLGVEDWRLMINLSTLNMQFCGSCILGQVFGYYFDGLVELGILTEDEALEYEYEAQGIAKSLGFHADNSEKWEELTNQWRQALSQEKGQES